MLDDSARFHVRTGGLGPAALSSGPARALRLLDVPASAAGPVHLRAAPGQHGTSSSPSSAYLLFNSVSAPLAVPSVQGRSFGLYAIEFYTSGTNAGRWLVSGAPTISATDRAELAVVVFGPAGTTPRVLRLSESTFWTAFSATSVNPAYHSFRSSVTPWVTQAHNELAAHATGWTVLVVDHAVPGVDLETLTYTAPPPPPPSQVTGVRVSPLDGGLRVSWSAAAGPVDVSQYRVDVADASGERVRRVYTEAGVLEAVVDGLANGVEYTVTVRALPSHGGENGPPSEARTATPRAGAGDTDGGAGDTEDVPVPALPLAGAGLLAGLLASAAYRLRRAGRRAHPGRR